MRYNDKHRTGRDLSPADTGLVHRADAGLPFPAGGGQGGAVSAHRHPAALWGHHGLYAGGGIRSLWPKVITVFHHNNEKGLPSHQGSVLLFDGETGTLRAMLDGGAITEIRTGAASAVATDLLARPDAEVLALIGSGAQARSHLLAIREIRRLREVRVWSPSLESDTRFAREMGTMTGLPVRICASAREAAEGADILCTLTPSKTPVLEREWLKPGAHVNAVGACSADARELSGELVRDSVFYCDSVESVLAESGDYLIPLREGLFGEEHLRGTVGELLLGKKPGRTSPEEITVYESLGLAVEDIACAEALCRPALLGR